MLLEETYEPLCINRSLGKGIGEPGSGLAVIRALTTSKGRGRGATACPLILDLGGICLSGILTDRSDGEKNSESGELTFPEEPSFVIAYSHSYSPQSSLFGSRGFRERILSPELVALTRKFLGPQFRKGPASPDSGN